MAKKIAEQLIDTLVKSGDERIYAVTGDSLNEVNEAVRKNDQIKWIHVRHEETGALSLIHICLHPHPPRQRSLRHSLERGPDTDCS